MLPFSLAVVVPYGAWLFLLFSCRLSGMGRGGAGGLCHFGWSLLG